MALRHFQTGFLTALLALPAGALADDAPVQPADDTPDYYSQLEDLSLRRDIADLGHGYSLRSELAAAEAGDDGSLIGYEAGSSGGYVNFGTPATGTFFGTHPAAQAEPWFDQVVFGFDWRPDVGGVEADAADQAASPESGEIGHIGVRADLTAALRATQGQDGGATAWRVSGMLGSTSLSLMPGGASLNPGDQAGKGLLWDVGVGWSSGGVSVNAGYLSSINLEGPEGQDNGFAVLSLGADYAILPGLSVYGEVNMIDGPVDPVTDGYGAVVLVGTGVSF